MSQAVGHDETTQLVFETERLRVQVASAADADLYCGLLTNPRVMNNVDFSHGLLIKREQIVEQLQEQAGRIFDRSAFT